MKEKEQNEPYVLLCGDVTQPQQFIFVIDSHVICDIAENDIPFALKISCFCDHSMASLSSINLCYFYSSINCCLHTYLKFKQTPYFCSQFMPSVSSILCVNFTVLLLYVCILNFIVALCLLINHYIFKCNCSYTTHKVGYFA